jgi:hypothetical protein
LECACTDLSFSIEHVLCGVVPLVQDSEDKGQGGQLPDNVFGKDAVVDPKSTVEPLPLPKDKKWVIFWTIYILFIY